MMPILHLPGEMMPGQFGPIRRDLESFSAAATRTMSSVGMPSVMQMTERQSGVDRFENRVRGKRRRNENHGAFAPVSLHGFADGVEHGHVEMFRAAFAGRHACQRLSCRIRSSAARGSCLRGPVRPCTITRVFCRPERSSRTSRQRHDFFGAVLHSARRP